MVKQKLTNKSLAEMWKALEDLENGRSNKDASAKCGVPRNTVLKQVKSKHKLTQNVPHWKKRERTPQEKIHVAGTIKK